MKEILIINGSGGVGKDTFVGCLSRFRKVYHTSIVNPVKELAKQAGWDGGKTERDRKFLSDLKVLIDTYNDNNYKSMEKVMQDFRSGIIDADILCIDMREKFQIEKAQKDFGAKTVLVKRDAVAHIVSNIADAGVFDLTYDYVVENNGTIEDLALTAQRFLAKLEFPYDKVIYVSHPFQGKEENLREIESIVANLMDSHPNYLFLSPVHAFGYHYHSLDYNKGLKECLWLLARSTEMWVFGDSESSTGCKAEIEFCKTHNIPYSIFNTKERITLKVILFTQEGCNKCDLLKAQLVKKKIDFEEVTDVNTMVSLGLTKTPALKVGDELLDYNKAVEWVFKQ